MPEQGNAAAMREALMEIVLTATKAGITMGYDVACGIIRSKARAALAAPARNCDRYADELDAQLAFLNDVWLISVGKNTMLEKDKFENWTEQMKTRYGRWLFAPAEGGAS